MVTVKVRVTMRERVMAEGKGLTKRVVLPKGAISKATVYNTLKVFTERRLLRQLNLRDDRVIYDPNVERHHHFVDVDTGEIHDIDWDTIDVCWRENEALVREARVARTEAHALFALLDDSLFRIRINRVPIVVVTVSSSSSS